MKQSNRLTEKLGCLAKRKGIIDDIYEIEVNHL